MRADTELFKDKIEVSLDGRQVFYLFFGGAVIASLVFVLGVMVGKRVEARAHTDGSPATSAAHDPLAALDQLSQRDDLAFPSALAGAAREPLGEVDALLGGAGDEDTADEPGDGATEADEAGADEAEEPEDAARGEDRADGTDDSAAAESGEEPGAEDRPEAKFTLQLSSFRERAEADAFFAKLEQAGYSPYLVEAEVPGKGTWYRVRLGHYPSYEAALDAKKEFEDSQHIIAYVTRLRK